jgi:hypothetical protein
MGEVATLRVDFDSVTAERVAITQCATFVRRRIAEMQAAEAWLACGKELASLKSKLVRKTSRGENERIGWHKAFTLDPPEFPFKRRHADCLIQIYKFLIGSTLPIKKLPASSRALYALVANRFTTEQIAQCIADGLISPGSTEDEIKAVAKKLKLIKPAKRQPNLKTAPKERRRAAVLKLMQQLEITLEDLQNG